MSTGGKAPKMKKYEWACVSTGGNAPRKSEAQPETKMHDGDIPPLEMTPAANSLRACMSTGGKAPKRKSAAELEKKMYKARKVELQCDDGAAPPPLDMAPAAAAAAAPSVAQSYLFACDGTHLNITAPALDDP